MKKNSVFIILTSDLNIDGEILKSIYKKGDHVSKIGLITNDVKYCYTQSIEKGGISITEPTIINSKSMNFSSISIDEGFEIEYCDLEKNQKIKKFEYKVPDSFLKSNSEGIDHLAICCQKGALEKYINFFIKAFGFTDNRRENIYSDISAMKIAVAESVDKKIKFPMVEPLNSTSPLYKFLDYNLGTGIHHIAIDTTNIISQIEELKQKGVQFKKTPQKYYDDLNKSFNNYSEGIEDLRKNKILLDKDKGNKGYLLQIFTEPLDTRPTLFLEFIQRKGASGFGNGNILALYKSLEKEEKEITKV